jgi:acyl transferase domain-containing protein
MRFLNYGLTHSAPLTTFARTLTQGDIQVSVSFSTVTTGPPYRAFVTHQQGAHTLVVNGHVNNTGVTPAPIWLVFPGIGVQWPGMGKV